MKLWSVLFSLFMLAAVSCVRDHKCDCTPPPAQETKWKMSRIYGGFAGTEVAMNDAQRNALLTLKPNGTYVCRNTVTGDSTTGTLSISTSSSNVLYTFSPMLPVYPAPTFIVIAATNGKMTLSDGNPDGYWIDFLYQP